MVVSRTDADAIRDAIQALIFFAKSPPRTKAQHSEVGSAWQTIERLQPGSIEIPCRDSKEWVFQLRAAAWKVYSWIFHQSGALSSKDLQHLKDCQDTLRIIFTYDDAGASGESMPSQDATPKVAEAAARKSRARRGRKPDTDPKDDKRIAEAWASRQYKTFADMERELDLPTGAGKRAVDRHRKRK